MSAIANAFRAGGIWMYTTLAVVLLALVWTVVQTVISSKSERLPAYFWWVGPCAIVAVAGTGVGVELAEMLGAAQGAEPAERQLAIAKGVAAALNQIALAGLGSVVVGVGVALGAGISTYVDAADDSEPPAISVATVVAFGCVGAGVVTVWTFAMAEIGIPSVVFVAGPLVLGMCGCGLAVFVSERDDASTGGLSGDQLAASLGTVYAVLGGVSVSVAFGAIEAFTALENVSLANRGEFGMQAAAMIGQIRSVGWVGVGAAALVGLATVGGNWEGLNTRRFAVEGGVCLLLTVPAVAAVVYGNIRVEESVALFEDELLSGGDETQPDRYADVSGDDGDGGFGGAMRDGDSTSDDTGDDRAIEEMIEEEIGESRDEMDDRAGDREVDAGTERNPGGGNYCDKGDIRRTVSEKSKAIQYCYEKALQRDPSLEGRVVATWTIGLDGTVEQASIAESTLEDEKVESCVRRVVERMEFAEPDGGRCEINYPFEFSGPGGAE